MDLSPRARRFLERQPRAPHIDDLALVIAALGRANVPVTEPVLDFHRVFAGYPANVWGEEGPLGVVHRTVGPQSWFTPMEVGGYLEGDSPSLACADIHMSWEMMIELDGTFHCNGPESSSYFLWTEVNAFLEEFGETRNARVFRHDAEADELEAVFLPRLVPHGVEALSDEYVGVYATDSLAVSAARDGRRCTVLVAEGADPPELRGLRDASDQTPPTLRQLADDARSAFASRRHRAVGRLYTMADPEAGAALLAALPLLDGHTRIMALIGIGTSRHAPAIPALAALLAEPADGVALNVVAALAKIGGPGAVPPLVEATRHASDVVRRDAVISLGRVGDASALPALRERFGDAAKPDAYTGTHPSRAMDPISRHARAAVRAIEGRG